MAILKIKELYNPILELIDKCSSAYLPDIRVELAEDFYSPKDEAFDFGDKYYSVFEDRVNNACYNLYHAGLLIRVRRGTYKLSETEKKVVDSNDYIDNDYLWQFPEYREYHLHREISTNSKELSNDDLFN